MQVFNVYHSAAPPSSVVSKEIQFPYPVMTRVLRLNVVEGAPDIDVKIDLLGEDAENVYRKDPMFDKMTINRGLLPVLVSFFLSSYCVFLLYLQRFLTDICLEITSTLKRNTRWPHNRK